MIRRLILFFVIFCFCLKINSKPDVKSYEAVKELLNKYKRPVTILEIGIDSVHYAFDIAKEYDATCVIMLLGKLSYPEQYSIENKFNNIVIVNPRNTTHRILEVITRCEHFDVVLVHGVPHMLKSDHVLKTSWKRTIDLLLKFGDFTFINATGASRELINYIQQKNNTLVCDTKTKLYKFDTPKIGLDIARWNFQDLPILDKPRYPIESTFDKKVYYKDFCENGIKWLPGINLFTFVMLRGICPSNETIIKNINAMRDSKHNDLIIGNMIIQGTSVIPIDLDDPRWNGNLPKLIEAALMIFGPDNLRFKVPFECMQRYRSIIAKKKL